jgi:hypothetical protein
MDTPLRLAIDLDDTIMDTHNVAPGYKMGMPVLGAVQALQRLKAEGSIIVIFCLWADTEQRCEAIAKWCRFFEIPYDFITNKKPDVDWIIDNRAVRFTSWAETMAFLRDAPRE